MRYNDLKKKEEQAWRADFMLAISSPQNAAMFFSPGAIVTPPLSFIIGWWGCVCYNRTLIICNAYRLQALRVTTVGAAVASSTMFWTPVCSRNG